MGQTPYFFHTLAGKPGSTGATNLPGPAARFNAPSGVAADAAGNVYVADTANHTIREIALGGTVSTLAGIAGTSGSSDGPVNTAEFNFPTGVAVDSSGTVYVADWGNHLVRKISAGQVTTLAGVAGKAGSADGDKSTAQFNHPSGVAVDPLGQVYVADQGNDAIRIVTADGNVSTIVGMPGVAGAADGIGMNAQFNSPAGITYSGFGHLFVADTGNDTIREITASQNQWTVSTLAGSPGLRGTNDLVGAAARFNSPTGVATLSPGDVVVVTDFGNNTLRTVTLAGQVATLAGSPGTSGASGGAGNSTLLNWPAGIAVDGNGNFYVAESGNSVILEGSPVIGPLIITQPDSQTSVPDGNATFSVVAIGVQPLTYQWKLNGQDLPNAVTSSVEMDRLVPGGGGNVTVEVTSPYGDVTSSNAQLVVAVPDSFITVAGSPKNPGFADGAGADSRFDSPGGVATDTNGNIFVADTANHVIREIIPSGLTDCTVQTIAGSAGHSSFADGTGINAFFNFPYGVCVDTNGTVFVADSYNYVIRQIKFDGTNWNVTTLAGLPGTPGTNDGAGTNALFGLPVSLTVGTAGNIYLADYYNYELRQVTPDGIVSSLDGNGFWPGGHFAAQGAFELSSPAGITADGKGNLYVADEFNNQIFKVWTNAMYATWWAHNYAGWAGINPGTNDGSEYSAQFNLPHDVAGDTNDNYYVADTGNDTIRKIAPDQSVSTIGGIGGVSGSADGAGTNALFDEPRALVVDPNGIVYVADSGNSTIRKLLPDPLIAVQPQPQTVQLHSNATFNVVAASATDLTYQWLKNGQPISDETDSSLTIYGAQSGDAASYGVVVSNATVSVTSSMAELTVQAPPIIVSGPQSQIVTNGAKVTFSAYPIGTGPLSYQWLLNGAPLPGQTKTNLLIASVSVSDLGSYALAVNGPAGDTISTNALLTLSGQIVPEITWAFPDPIFYGAALTSNQLNATASASGSFAYTPANGTVPDSGLITLSAIFTPTDTALYTSITDAVSIFVSPAVLTVTASNAIRPVGAANPVFTGAITGLTNGDNITATYSTTATTSSPAATYPIVPTLVDPNNRQTNYTVSLIYGTLTVGQVAEAITWAIPAPIIYGTALSSNQLDAAANVSGSFAYNPTSGAVLNAGPQTLSVIFTPTDTLDFSSLTNSVSLLVSRAPLTVTASNASRQAGAANPVFTGTITGLTNGDNITPTYSTTATINSPAGKYAIVPSLVDPNNRQSNYRVSLVDGTLTVSPLVVPPTFTILHVFAGVPYVALGPESPLLLSGNTLYGTTPQGGTQGGGTVFKINTDGANYSILANFSGAPPTNGVSPQAGVILSGNTLYGTAMGGGNSESGTVSASGTVFKVNTDGSNFAPVYTFTNGNDGAQPMGGLILSGSTLYGTTYGGLSLRKGSVFKVNTDGTQFVTLHAFNGNDGVNPEAGLILSGNALYGTTVDGGSSGNGTVFAVNTDGSGFTNLHNFTAYSVPFTNSDGAYPIAGLILSGNALYGTAATGGSSGNGTVFTVNTDGTGFTTLYNFAGAPSYGTDPPSALILSGNTLYGTAHEFSVTGGSGFLFALTLASSAPVPIPLNLQLDGEFVVLSWQDPALAFSLQSAPNVTGVFTNIPAATSPYTNAITGAQQFFRLMAN